MRGKIVRSVGLISASLIILFSVTYSPFASALAAKTTTIAKKTTAPAPLSKALSPNGFRVSPVRSDLTIAAGTSQTVQISVLNLTTDSGPVQPVVDDFVAGNNEIGIPEILISGQAAPSHGLKSYVVKPQPFNISSNQTYELNVTIKIPKDTPAGGYYGAVRFLPYNPATPGAGKNVALTGSVASLILVTVPGKVNQQMSIASFDIRKLITPPYTFSGPNWLFPNSQKLYAVVRFDNTGGIQEQPFGKIILEKGKTVLDTTAINDSVPLGSVLPNSIRMFYEPLSGLGSFGKYTILGNFGYGSDGQLLSDAYSFYIIPTIVFIAAGILLLIILFLIFLLPRMLRARDRRVKRSSRGNRW